MAKITDTNVASVAKQATDAAGIVAMIDVKIATPASLVIPADCAPPLLGAEQLVVSPDRDSVGRLENVVLSKSRIFFSPFAAAFGPLLQVLLTPFGVERDAASPAVHRVSVLGSARFEELRQRLRLLALRASLKAGGKVESASWHTITYSSNFMLRQGAV